MTTSMPSATTVSSRAAARKADTPYAGGREVAHRPRKQRRRRQKPSNSLVECLSSQGGFTLIFMIVFYFGMGFLGLLVELSREFDDEADRQAREMRAVVDSNNNGQNELQNQMPHRHNHHNPRPRHAEKRKQEQPQNEEPEPVGDRLHEWQQQEKHFRHNPKKSEAEHNAHILPGHAPRGRGRQPRKSMGEWGNQPKQPKKLKPKLAMTSADVGHLPLPAAAFEDLPNHLHPIVPVLPIFESAPIEAKQLMENVFQKQNPTLAGVQYLLQDFLVQLHVSNQHWKDIPAGVTPMDAVNTFFDVAIPALQPFEEQYRDELIFPVREDDSLFLSLAAYREGLLADTLKYAFSHARHPEKLFVGAVVQNCFGRVLDDGTIDTSGKPCKTGHQVVGKKNGQDQVRISNVGPDPNGIEDFCGDSKYARYCENGQLRVLYVHETESQGPAMARYYASKLWGGETYFVQCDAHLQFANHWDQKYIDEIHATRSFPKSVLSSYPPGFTPGTNDGTVNETPGTRLCVCETFPNEPNPIVRLTAGTHYHGHEKHPTQIPFIAAGFFFTRAEFLRDVPFDPFLPWCFMGEEIALSIRAWTHGWDIYAPRKNLIAHQYRPGRMGLPKFWETVNRLFHGMTGTNEIQHIQIRRIKNMVGYPDSSKGKITKAGHSVILTDLDHYSLGHVRSWQDYLDFADLYIDDSTDVIMCSDEVEWCNMGLKK